MNFEGPRPKHLFLCSGMQRANATLGPSNIAFPQVSLTLARSTKPTSKINKNRLFGVRCDPWEPLLSLLKLLSFLTTTQSDQDQLKAGHQHRESGGWGGVGEG